MEEYKTLCTRGTSWRCPKQVQSSFSQQPLPWQRFWISAVDRSPSAEQRPKTKEMHQKACVIPSILSRPCVTEAVSGIRAKGENASEVTAEIGRSVPSTLLVRQRSGLPVPEGLDRICISTRGHHPLVHTHTRDHYNYIRDHHLLKHDHHRTTVYTVPSHSLTHPFRVRQLVPPPLTPRALHHAHPFCAKISPHPNTTFAPGSNFFFR